MIDTQSGFIRCPPEVQAHCPDRSGCTDPSYLRGSPCDEFARATIGSEKHGSVLCYVACENEEQLYHEKIWIQEQHYKYIGVVRSTEKILCFYRRPADG